MRKLNTLIRNIVIVASLALAHQTVIAANDQSTAASDAEQVKMILHYVNAYRAKHHLAPLKMNQKMSEEAEKHSQAMANKSVRFGHTGFNGRIKRLCHEIKGCRGGAENVAYYKLDAKKLVEQWLASPGHRRNIAGNYTLTGIGIAHHKTKKGWAYFTQIFIRKNTTKIG